METVGGLGWGEYIVYLWCSCSCSVTGIPITINCISHLNYNPVGPYKAMRADGVPLESQRSGHVPDIDSLLHLSQSLKDAYYRTDSVSVWTLRIKDPELRRAYRRTMYSPKQPKVIGGLSLFVFLS